MLKPPISLLVILPLILPSVPALAAMPPRPSEDLIWHAAAGDLWVSAENGDDGNDGLTPATAFRSIQQAAELAGSGPTLHIRPGVFRELRDCSPGYAAD